MESAVYLLAVTGVACVYAWWSGSRQQRQSTALLQSSIDRSVEYILCSAIHYDDGTPYVHQPKNISSGIVVAGRGHHNAFAVLYSLVPTKKLDKTKMIQGFLTSRDRFVSREEAYVLAIASRQILPEKTALFEKRMTSTLDRLDSGDLY